MNEIYLLLIFASVSVIYLFIISKLLGKKQIAQLDFIDYVLGISIGSIAAEMATDVSETPFYYYLIAITIFFLFDVLITFLGRKGPRFKHFFKGKPIMIIYEGNLCYENLVKSKLDVNDVIGLCRELGYFDLNDIAYAVFENSGKLSVLPKGNVKPTTIEDLKEPKIKQAKLPTYLVIDGHISFSSLSEINKDLKWLFNKLKIKKKSELKNIILAQHDDENNSVIINTKN